MVIAHVHNIYTLDDALRSLIANVDLISAHCPENVPELLANGASFEQIRVVEHGVRPLENLDRSAARSSLGLSESDKLIVVFGFIQAHKGIEGAIEVFARVVEGCSPSPALHFRWNSPGRPKFSSVSKRS